nr:type IV secretory system conjugative DNA transfer family protein [uncultured Allomuricauda sp.]
MDMIRSYAILGFVFLVTAMLLYVVFSTKRKVGIILTLIGVGLLYTGLYIYFSPLWLWVLLGAILITVPFYPLGNNSSKKNSHPYTIVLKHKKGAIEFYNPFLGFLVYGGAGSGKTVSLGKPLLSEFMRLGFVFFIYDAKDNDYTKTAFWLKEKLGYPHPIYNIDIVNLSHGYQFNLFAPHLFDNESEVEEMSTVLFKVLAKKVELNEWDDKARGVLNAAAFYIFKYHKEHFTVPHILNLATQTDGEDLIELFEGDPTCKSYAKAFIGAKGSPATLSSIVSTLAGVIGAFAANKRICYVLNGNDFDFYLNDPENPKSVAITNNFKLREQISPLVVLMFVMAMKRINLGNTVPMVGFLDEGTTFKIENLEAYPSEMREYLFAMVILTQNPGKIEKLYGKHDRSSLESNVQNHFYGRTKDLEAAKHFTQMFATIDKERRSVTTRTNSEGASTTRSIEEKARYKPEFFKDLKPGEFVGGAVESNLKEFKVRFKPYAGSKLEENPFVKMVTAEDLERNYNLIIEDVRAMALQKLRT